MKKHILYLQILIVLSVTCCSFRSDESLKKDVDDPNRRTRKIPSDHIVDTSQETILRDFQIDSPCRNLVLQIVNENYGLIEPSGKLLGVRIINNGNAEYDYYANDPDSILRKEVKLSDRQLTTIKEILESKDLIDAKDEYNEDTVCIDAFTEKEIAFCSSDLSKTKTIRVNDCSVHDNKKEKPPSKILYLLKFIKKITSSVKE